MTSILPPPYSVEPKADGVGARLGCGGEVAVIWELCSLGSISATPSEADVGVSAGEGGSYDDGARSRVVGDDMTWSVEEGVGYNHALDFIWLSTVACLVS